MRVIADSFSGSLLWALGSRLERKKGMQTPKSLSLIRELGQLSFARTVSVQAPRLERGILLLKLPAILISVGLLIILPILVTAQTREARDGSSGSHLQTTHAIAAAQCDKSLQSHSARLQIGSGDGCQRVLYTPTSPEPTSQRVGLCVDFHCPFFDGLPPTVKQSYDH